MAQFVNQPGEGGPQILECHSPIMNLIEKYEIIGRLEQEMFEKVLGAPVRREATRTSGLYEAAFYFALYFSPAKSRALVFSSNSTLRQPPGSGRFGVVSDEWEFALSRSTNFDWLNDASSVSRCGDRKSRAADRWRPLPD